MLLLCAAVLFFVLSPGILITLPPGSFFSGRTSVVAAAVHAVVFFAVGYLLMYGFPDGFRNPSLAQKYADLYPVGPAASALGMQGPGRTAELGYPRGTLAQISV
jgi:hypothetical protein